MAAKPRIEFRAEDHTYLVEGIKLPSVTEIIGAVVPRNWEAGVHWGMRLARQGLSPDNTRDKAAALGTEIHVALAELAAGNTVDKFDYSENAGGYIDGLERFLDAHQPDFFDSECPTASVSHGYAGTLDAHVKFTRGKYKGRTARFDLKTGKKVYKESHFPQVAAYEGAELECGKDPSDLQLILKVMPTGRYSLIESTDEYEDFLVLLAHYQSIQRRNERTTRSRPE